MHRREPLLAGRLGLAVFGMSVLGAVLGLVACDSGPTTTITSSGSAAERGQAVYMQYCNACHPGGGRGAGPSLIGEVAESSDSRLKDVVRNGRRQMPAYDKKTISDDQLSDLLTYLRTLK